MSAWRDCVGAGPSGPSPSDEGMLSPYRVLDLTDERGLLCGKILADLGADVIQVEPPTGSSARRIGPFYQDEVHPERSLFWWAYASNKRSITLNLTTADGQAPGKPLGALLPGLSRKSCCGSSVAPRS